MKQILMILFLFYLCGCSQEKHTTKGWAISGGGEIGDNVNLLGTTDQAELTVLPIAKRLADTSHNNKRPIWSKYYIPK